VDGGVFAGLLALSLLLGRAQSGAAAKGSLDPVSGLLRSLVGVLGRPLGEGLDGAGKLGRRLSEGDRLERENEILRTRLNALDLYAERIGRLEGEVGNLRTLAGLRPLPGRTRITADVVDFAQYEGRLTLSAGKDEGIAPGMPVISADGLVGIVQVAWTGGCQATLITNAGVQVGGIDLSRKPPTEGLMKGRDPATLALTFFDPNAAAQTGDTVVTSGHSERIPRMLRVGKIVSIEDDREYGLRRAIVAPFFSPGTLKEVQILR